MRTNGTELQWMDVPSAGAWRHNIFRETTFGRRSATCVGEEKCGKCSGQKVPPTVAGSNRRET